MNAAYRTEAAELATVREAIARLEGERAAVVVPTTPVMRELPPDARRHTHVMIRGNFLDRGDEVAPATPAALHPFPAEQPRDRLGFARWLVDPANPLFARVAVNRFWERLFGDGLVTTGEEFGAQGEPPTHPDLLDWLASRFVEDDYSVKALLRRVVLSATYRQDSSARADLDDPRNRLLGRGPAFRLPAETIRDSALAIAGLLSAKMYGPSVMPYQPSGLWQVVYNSDDWKTSAGEDRYRRGLYTFWRRTSPYPSMVVFDAPSREFCVVERIRTNTPLQALVTLNDPVYVEAAQALARRLLTEATSDGERIVRAFRLCTARLPTDLERERVAALLTDERERLDVERATELAGPAPLPSGTDVVEVGAWTIVANVMLNLDEVLSKR